MAVVFSRGGALGSLGQPPWGHAMEHVLVLKITLFTLFTQIFYSSFILKEQSGN